MKIQLVDSVIRAVKEAHALGVLFGGVVLAAASVVLGFWMIAHSLGLFAAPIIALGCFLSGFVFCRGVDKCVFISRSVHAEDAAEIQSLKNQLDEKNQRIDSSTDEIAKLKAENARLSHQRIDVAGFEPIMQLALAEAKLVINDVVTAWEKEEFQPEAYFGLSKPKCSQYVGVLQQRFTSKIGIDMQNIRVQDTEDVLFVSGVSACNIGTLDNERDWLIREKQTFVLKEDSGPTNVEDTADGFYQKGQWFEKDLKENVETEISLDAVCKESKKQEDSLQARINDGTCEHFKAVESYVERMGQEVIRCYLAPYLRATHKELRFIGAVPSNGPSVPLLTFANAYNRGLENAHVCDAKQGMIPAFKET